MTLSATIDLIDIPTVSDRRGDAWVERTLHNVPVDDLSSVGFSFVHHASLAIGTLVQIDLDGQSEGSARIIERVGNTYRCTFLTAMTGQAIHDDRWPRWVRVAIFLLAGIGAWVAALTIFGVLR